MKSKIAFTCFACLVLFELVIGPSFTQLAESQGLPPRPPTATPTRTPSPVGAHILLELRSEIIEARDLWSVAQWKDSNGTWHDVEGWRGKFNQDLQVRWWVDSKDFGKGPFRWVVYSVEDDHKVLWTSPSFVLPFEGEIQEMVIDL